MKSFIKGAIKLSLGFFGWIGGIHLLVLITILYDAPSDIILYLALAVLLLVLAGLTYRSQLHLSFSVFLKSFVKQWYLVLLGLVAGYFAAQVILLGTHLEMAPLEPRHIEAQRMCEEDIPKGMTYGMVKEKYGHLFSEWHKGLMDDGSGFVDLKNDVRYIEATCRVIFKAGKVEETSWYIAWL